MNSLRELMDNIITSLYYAPGCDFTELMTRDFLHTKSTEGVSRLVGVLVGDGLVREGNNPNKAEWGKLYLTVSGKKRVELIEN